MGKEGRYKGRCKCGKVLTFQQGPWGYKAVCPECKAVVRLKPPAVRTDSGMVRQWTDSVIVVTCRECGQKYPATFRNMGRRVDCPKCATPNLVPMPGRKSSVDLGKRRTEDTDATDEIPLDDLFAEPDETPPPEPEKPESDSDSILPPDLDFAPLDDEP